MRRYRSLSAVVSAIAVFALVGGLLGRHLVAADDKVPDHYKAFTAALSAIETSYIDKVDSDRLIYSAIRGMLGTLDPHSSFMDPRAYAALKDVIVSMDVYRSRTDIRSPAIGPSANNGSRASGA